MIEIKVTKILKESTISRILELVENATEKKAHTENFISKFARIYTPLVILIALLITIFPTTILKQDFLTWVYRALTFLVVACPCALVVSVPMSFFGGIGCASREGILVKGSNYIELLSKINTVVFDKTGTLTKGVFKVQRIEPKENKEKILKYAAYAEYFSNHPIANTIKDTYGKEIENENIKEVEEISGKGVIAYIEGKEIRVGNIKLMEDIIIDSREENGTNVYVAVDRKCLGKIVISDEIKEDSKETIRILKNMGISKTIMLTGDRKETGEEVAKTLGIEKVYADLLPVDKVEKMQEIMKEKESKSAFVGDGLNDAPVIAMADCGIAMGAYGTDAAIEAADVVIMKDKPSQIITAIRIARKTILIAKENIIIALAIKFAVLILSFFGITTMWEAVFADVGVTIIATLNALRTLKP